MTIRLKLDAGHGGKDGGAEGNGLLEKDLTLKICKEIKKGLEEYQNIEVGMTRNTDIYLTLEERANMANRWNADILMSIHINSATTTSAKGFESFIYSDTNNQKTTAFQNIVHAEIMKAIDMQDRGKKRANFHILRETNMIALLTENGFIVNASDAQKLKSDAYIKLIAQGHVNGVVSFYGLKKKPKSPTPPITTGGENIARPSKLFKVQVGAFSNRENAEELAKKLEKSGYKPFISEE